MISETVQARFSEDSADPIVMRLGSKAAPQDLTGWAATIRLKDLTTGEVITSGTTTILTPFTAGRVERHFQSGERVAGRKFAVECVTTDNEGRTRTWPGPGYRQLEVHIVPRRTAE